MNVSPLHHQHSSVQEAWTRSILEITFKKVFLKWVKWMCNERNVAFPLLFWSSKQMKCEIILTPKKNTFDTGFRGEGSSCTVHTSHFSSTTSSLHYVRGVTQYAACVLSLALQRWINTEVTTDLIKSEAWLIWWTVPNAGNVLFNKMSLQNVFNRHFECTW